MVCNTNCLTSILAFGMIGGRIVADLVAAIAKNTASDEAHGFAESE